MSQEKQWTEVFHAIDKDKNGFLTREEIAQCLKEVGVCPSVADVSGESPYFLANVSLPQPISKFPYETLKIEVNVCTRLAFK